MVLIAADLPHDANYASGAFSHYINPPAIHLVIPGVAEELKQIFALYQGSGGVVASRIGINPSGSNTQVKTSPQNSLVTAPQNNLATAVNEICSTFGLTKEELAKVCNIQSRKTLYNWINGEAKPRKSAMNRLFDLLITARAWASSGFTSDRDQIHAPVLEHKSVFDLLSQPKIDRERILFAGSRLNILFPSKDSLSDPFA